MRVILDSALQGMRVAGLPCLFQSEPRANRRDVDAAIAMALAAIDDFMAESGIAAFNTSAMFDLDRTLCRNDGSAIESVVALLHALQQRGVRCVVVTARPEEGAAKTFCDLQNVGVRDVRVQCFPCDAVGYQSDGALRLKAVLQFKRAMRTLISDELGPMVVVVGDEWWDVTHNQLGEIRIGGVGTGGVRRGDLFMGAYANEALLTLKLPGHIM